MKFLWPALPLASLWIGCYALYLVPDGHWAQLPSQLTVAFVSAISLYIAAYQLVKDL